MLEKLAEGTLTTDYNDTKGEGDIKDQIQSLVYVDYTKGTEDYVEIVISFSHTESDFFSSSYIYYDSDADEFLLKELPIRMRETGRRRIPLPVSILETKIEVKARGFNLGGSPGTVKIFHHTSHHVAPWSWSK